jgi:seryl-tRNA synthetase
MLQLTVIRSNADEVVNRLSKRGIDARPMIDHVLELDEKSRDLRTSLEQNKAEQNRLAKEIGQLFKAGNAEEAAVLRTKTAQMKEQSKGMEEDLAKWEGELKEALLAIPNTPADVVKAGKSAEENEEVYRWGEPDASLAGAMPHWELAKKFDLIDFELGVKIAGAGFPVYKGKGARLQRALINFFLDEAMKAGYTEIQPPIVVNEDSGYGTGQLPDKEGQMYFVNEDQLYLIPTAEVPITNIYRDVILHKDELPVKNVGYTPCFRREAGSYGKDVRGLNRLHQFDKVEIVQIAHPDQSYAILEEMQSYVQGLLKKLGLTYRVLRLCGGDMGFTSALTYDMEVWSAAQERWLEVSSVSNFEGYQSNRLRLRFRTEDGKTSLAHTLNGSGLALPRILAALLENNQDEHGIRMPAVLHPYLGFNRIE